MWGKLKFDKRVVLHYAVLMGFNPTFVRTHILLSSNILWLCNTEPGAGGARIVPNLLRFREDPLQHQKFGAYHHLLLYHCLTPPTECTDHWGGCQRTAQISSCALQLSILELIGTKVNEPYIRALSPPRNRFTFQKATRHLRPRISGNNVTISNSN